jgi:hypothetical protein
MQVNAAGTGLIDVVRELAEAVKLISNQGAPAFWIGRLR